MRNCPNLSIDKSCFREFGLKDSGNRSGVSGVRRDSANVRFGSHTPGSCARLYVRIYRNGVSFGENGSRYDSRLRWPFRGDSNRSPTNVEPTSSGSSSSGRAVGSSDLPRPKTQSPLSRSGGLVDATRTRCPFTNNS